MIYRNFTIAVWISIIWALQQFAWIAMHAQKVDTLYGPFTPKVVFFPIVVGGAQLLLWFFVYRDRDIRARVAAGAVAAFFVLQVIIMGLQASVDIRISGVDLAFFCYFAVSHALFAFTRRADAAGSP